MTRNMKRSILIVDDDPDMCLTLKGVFEQKGYDVSVASSGVAAINFVEKKAYTIVLADLIMDKINGADLIGKIKDIRPDISSYVMTAYMREDLLKQAMQKGCKRVFTKPFDIDEMLEVFEAEVEEK